MLFLLLHCKSVIITECDSVMSRCSECVLSCPSRTSAAWRPALCAPRSPRLSPSPRRRCSCRAFRCWSWRTSGSRRLSRSDTHSYHPFLRNKVQFQISTCRHSVFSALITYSSLYWQTNVQVRLISIMHCTVQIHTSQKQEDNFITYETN